MTNSMRNREKREEREVMKRNRKKDTAREKKGGYREGALPVAIATAGSLVQSPHQCLVARERFRQRERRERGGQLRFSPTTLQDPG